MLSVEKDYFMKMRQLWRFKKQFIQNFVENIRGETHSYMHRDPAHMETFDIERENDSTGEPVLKQ